MQGVLRTASVLAALLCGLSAAAAVLRPGPPVPADNPMSAAKVELGRRLFYDADLSVNGTMSCATCHEQKHAFADGNVSHPGALDDPGRRNVPGLANVGWFPRLTWADPRQTSLEKQVAVPVFGDDPVEMAMKGHEDEIARRLGRDPCYVEMFARAFPESGGAIRYPLVARAIAAFERTLVSRGSPYDLYARGDAAALSPAAQQGLRIFERECASCHAGPDFTDTAYHRIASHPAQDTGDRGLAEVTGEQADEGKFRTPGLRNASVTAPYLHDGSAPAFADAIRAHDAFAALPEAKEAPLEAFLASLTDEHFLKDPRFALPDADSCSSRPGMSTTMSYHRH